MFCIVISRDICVYCVWVSIFRKLKCKKMPLCGTCMKKCDKTEYKYVTEIFYQKVDILIPWLGNFKNNFVLT